MTKISYIFIVNIKGNTHGAGMSGKVRKVLKYAKKWKFSENGGNVLKYAEICKTR